MDKAEVDALVATYLKDGVVVIPSALTEPEIIECREGLHRALKEFGVDHDHLKETAQNLVSLQTHSSGGLPFHYSDWRIRLCALNKRVMQVSKAIWEVSWAVSAPGYECPFAPFDPSVAYSFIDSINFRLPSELVASIPVPKDYHEKALQKPLREHIDINPWDPWGGRKGNTRWRPLQGFISLTSSAGGFECAPGFHTKVLPFFQTISHPPNYNQGFISLQGKIYKPIHDGFRSIEYAAGCAVLWDWRLPHRVAEVHPGPDTREVVYTSFFPDIPLNRRYVAEQWACIERGTFPPDFARKKPGKGLKHSEEKEDLVPDYHPETFFERINEQDRIILGKPPSQKFK